MTQNLFIGIGAQKCASTWLYDILRDHPDVALSHRKEVDFFSHHYERGYQWYASQFPAAPEGRLRGEISPSYFVDRDVPERILALAPDARILVSLRDPVERALSNHRHEVRIGHFSGPDLSFEAGFENNPMYLEQSRYGTHLRRWLDHVHPTRLLIVLQEEIEADPVSVAQQVYRFLEIDPGHVSAALHVRSNESHLHRSSTLEAARKGLRGVFRSLGMDGVWRAAQNAGLQRLYRRLNRRAPTSRIPPVSAATRQHLRERLEEEIRLVEELLGRPLPSWRSGGRASGPSTGGEYAKGRARDESASFPVLGLGGSQ